MADRKKLSRKLMQLAGFFLFPHPPAIVIMYRIQHRLFTALFG